MLRKINWTKVFISILLFVFVLFLSYVYSVVRDDFDMDLIWHLKIGEDILKTKTIFLENTYSWIKGTVWTQQEWLFDVLLYLVVSVGGLFGFGFIHFTTGFTYIYHSIYKKEMHFKILMLCIVLLMYIFGAFNRLNRPAEYSALFFPLMLWLYSKQYCWKPILYFVVGLFLSNFHCGAIVALSVLMVLVFVSDIIMTKLYEYFDSNYCDKLSKGFTVQYVMSILLFFIGTCVNPYGIKQIINMFCVSSLKSTEQIMEWAPLSSSHYMTWIILFFIAYSFGFALKKHMKNREDVRNIIVLSAFLVLSCVSGKGFIMFFYLFLAFGLKYTDEMIYDIGLQIGFTKEWFQKKLECDFENLQPKTKGFPLILLFSAIVFASISFSSDMTMDEFIETSQNEYVDSETIIYLQESLPSDAKLSHGYVTGNYLLYHDIPVFIDARQQPYCTEFGWTTALDDYFDTKPYNMAQMNALFDKYNFDYVLANKDFPADWYLSENEDDWRVVFTNDEQTIRVWERIQY